MYLFVCVFVCFFKLEHEYEQLLYGPCMKNNFSGCPQQNKCKVSINFNDKVGFDEQKSSVISTFVKIVVIYSRKAVY